MDFNQLTDFVREHTNSTVLNGPFAGMALSNQFPWSRIDNPSKMLGTYEQELHPYLTKFKARNYDCVVDVGCAEGYYAVGLAKLYSNSTVFAYDINPEARAVCEDNAVINSVNNRVVVKELCDGASLKEHSQIFQRLLIFCDCEGFELDLFDDIPLLNSLAKADLIVECHDIITPGTTELLVEKFSKTHKVTVVYSGPRDPNSAEFLKKLPDILRWHAVCEHRPCQMNWIVCESKSHNAIFLQFFQKPYQKIKRMIFNICG